MGKKGSKKKKSRQATTGKREEVDGYQVGCDIQQNGHPLINSTMEKERKTATFCSSEELCPGGRREEGGESPGRPG